MSAEYDGATRTLYPPQLLNVPLHVRYMAEQEASRNRPTKNMHLSPMNVTPCCSDFAASHRYFVMRMSFLNNARAKAVLAALLYQSYM